MNKTTKIALIALFATIIGGTIHSDAIYALNSEDEASFAQNDILFYDPDECVDGDDAGGNIDVCDASLPKDTKKMLDNENIKKKAEENIERYKYAEKKTGLPWQVVAVLHYNEANMASDRSITNGEPLTDHTNVDGVKVSSDANKDAENAANIFINNAKTHYNIDIIANKSEENYGWAFLAYNRGGMYKCHGNRSYKESPYVMNFYDDDHKRMKWISGADDTDCQGNILNGVGGSVSERPGALALLAYLCGGESDKKDSSDETKGDKSDNSGSDSPSDDEITLVGDSISVSSEKQLKEKFKGSFLSMVGSRHPTSKGSCDGDQGGYSVLETIIKGSGKVKTQSYDSGCKDLKVDKYSARNNIVWELGTNPTGATEETIEKVIDLIDKRNLFLVTVYNGNDKTSADNISEMYRKIADKHDNVYIVDWNKAVRNDESKYITRSDGMAVHPTEEGQKLLAELIEKAVNDLGGCPTFEGKYPEYSQCGDSRWANESYPYKDGGTYCSGGCGPSSMALVASYVTGSEILPTDIGNLTLSKGTYVNDGLLELDKIVADKYGLELVQFLPSSNDEYLKEMKKYLKDGYSLHILGSCGPSYATGINCPFTNGGHFVGIFEMTGEDTVMVADSNLINKEYKLEDVVNSGIYGSVSAFKGTGSRQGCNNASICDSKNGGNVGPVKGSLTVEQAQKLADNYNNNVGNWKGKVAMGDPILGGNNYATGLSRETCGTHCNCVLFSAFFTELFTDMPLRQQWPNGGTVVSEMALWGFVTGTTPQPYSVFSTANHTGVVVAVNDDGTVTTIEAGYQRDEDILAGAKASSATVYPNKDVTGYSFAYLNDNRSKYKLDGNKLNEYLQKGKISE